MIDNLISLMLGIWLGACSGFIFAGLFGGTRDDEEDVSDK
jgi:hypothetical protein